ncbi:MAG: tRNA (adenosine(37)-N6)-threonylcarbamoyltransferase complex dimerization subunit type 1 TsaB [Candidatus Nanopelagicales bacterium]|jgi:tRNA threonylcarbamoyl adenosine modification protein YeaZ|nr:tRNA (adenosine(37)-N6)-threonylcarbamoyltransferase complex dimerization subunit type 1 TsaB [Candidatus Nanopelagicales bacterium]
MLILALDTATEAVGAAVVDTTADEVLGTAGFLGPAAHGEQLAPLVARALDLAGVGPRDLGAIGVGRGPGPFTGLRVGLVHAAVMGWALGLPVQGVCTLDVLAAQARAAGVSGPFLVATDARRREVYWARYDAAGIRVDGPHVGAAAGIADRSLPAVGAGAAKYPEDLPAHRAPLHPDPATLARIAGELVRSGVPADLTPMYLRRPDAMASSTRKRVTQP